MVCTTLTLSPANLILKAKGVATLQSTNKAYVIDLHCVTYAQSETSSADHEENCTIWRMVNFVVPPGHAAVNSRQVNERHNNVVSMIPRGAQEQILTTCSTSMDRARRVSVGLLAAAALATSLSPAACATAMQQQVSQPQEVVMLAEASRQVFFDVTADGEPLGRITVELFVDVPVGVQRFVELTQGLDGASYRRSKFEEITPEYVRNSGVKQLTYRADAQVRLAGGADTFALEEELAQHRHAHDGPGVVSIIVRDAEEREVKEKLVAYKGKLINVQEVQGEAPNGTAWVVTRGPAPALDATNLPIGVVTSGLEVVEKLGALPVVKDNSSSPYFKAGKLVGDRRADVAERAFNKPFAKVIVAAAGLQGVQGNVSDS